MVLVLPGQSIKSKSLNRKDVQQISTRSDIVQEMAMNQYKLHKATIIVYTDLKISILLIVIPDQYLYSGFSDLCNTRL